MLNSFLMSFTPAVALKRGIKYNQADVKKIAQKRPQNIITTKVTKTTDIPTIASSRIGWFDVVWVGIDMDDNRLTCRFVVGRRETECIIAREEILCGRVLSSGEATRCDRLRIPRLLITSWFCCGLCLCLVWKIRRNLSKIELNLQNWNFRCKDYWELIKL